MNYIINRLLPDTTRESHYGKTSGRGQRSKFDPFCTDFNLIFFARVGAQRCPSCCRFSLCRQQLEWLSLVCTSKLSSFGLGEDLAWKAEEHEESDWLCFEYSTYNCMD